MARETKIPVFHIFHNQDVELYEAKVKEDKVYLDNERVAQFNNSGVFTIKDHTGKRLRKFKAVIYLDGKAQTSEIKSKKEIIDTAIADTNQEVLEKNPALKNKIIEKLQRIIDTAESIFEPITDKDRKTIVKREVAKQLGKFKPIETWQFVLIIVLLSALIALRFIPI